MKSSTIDKVIRAKIKDWTGSITDRHLAVEVKNSVVVTGGCIVSLYLQEKVNDYDIYIQNPLVLEKLVKYYMGKFKKSELSNEGKVIYNKDFTGDRPEGWGDNRKDRIGVLVRSTGFLKEATKPLPTDKDIKYRPVFISENAITLSDDIQIVMRFWGAPSDVHQSFDYEHAKGYWTVEDGLVSTARQLQLILAKELEYTGSEYPLASIFRSRKFIQRHWTMHVKNYLLMALQLQKHDLKNIEVLREQLTGVDASYLFWIIQHAEKAISEGQQLTLEKVFDIVMKAAADFGDIESGEEDEYEQHNRAPDMPQLQAPSGSTY